MNFAFGISEDDVLIVLNNQFGVNVTAERLTELFDDIDADKVESEALCADDLDEQTNYAHDEIARQLIEMGAVPPRPEPAD